MKFPASAFAVGIQQRCTFNLAFFPLKSVRKGAGALPVSLSQFYLPEVCPYPIVKFMYYFKELELIKISVVILGFFIGLFFYSQNKAHADSLSHCPKLKFGEYKSERSFPIYECKKSQGPEKIYKQVNLIIILYENGEYEFLSGHSRVIGKIICKDNLIHLKSFEDKPIKFLSNGNLESDKYGGFIFSSETKNKKPLKFKTTINGKQINISKLVTGC